MPVVRGTAELVAVLPHLFGYQLDHSVVLLTTRVENLPGPSGTARGTIGGSARIDLPPVEHLGDLARQALPMLRGGPGRTGSLLLHVLAFDLPGEADGEPDEDYADELTDVAFGLADELGAHLHDLVHVRDQEGVRVLRQVVLAGAEVEGGWVLLPQPADVPAAADLVLQGRGVLGSRGEVAAALRRRDEAASAATDLAVDLLGLRPDRLDEQVALQVLAWVVEGGQVPRARDRAWLTVLLHDRTVRDGVLARWLPEIYPPSAMLDEPHVQELCGALPCWSLGEHDAALGRLLTLISMVPLRLAAPLYTLAAQLAWSHGDGTIANEACDAALEIDPHYRMALLMQRVLAHGIRPSSFTRPGDPGCAA